jgi:predicted molibdopterin-dependent oxidoreductase YjgC
VLTTIYDENQGFHNGQLCVRGRFGYQFVNSDKRLTTPLIRRNGNLVDASWDEALEAVAVGLKGAGAASAALATARLTNEELVLFKQLMETAGSSKYDHSAGYAHGALTEGLARSFGSAASSSTILDIQKSDLLLVIKTDAYETHPVVGFEINMAVKNKGVQLRILSDKSGKLSKLPNAKTLVHTPGSEIVLINSLAKVLLDNKLADASAASYPGYAELEKALADFTPEAVSTQCGLGTEDIKLLAEAYAKADKALILFPVGQAYPGHSAALANAVANLALLAGKLGKEGSGVLCLSEKNNSQGAVDMGFHAAAGGLDAGQIIDGCADGSIKTLLIAGENPLVSYPDHARIKAALDKVEFLVVSEMFMTETAAMADVVLPVCSFAEKEGTFTATDRRVQYIKPAIRKIGQSRSDFEIFSGLIAKLGVTAPASPASIFVEIAASTPGYDGMSYASLGEDGRFAAVTIKPAFVVPQVPSVKSEPGRLALVTGSALYHNGTLSQYGEGPMHVCPEGYVELSRADATAFKFAENDLLTVSSASGSMKLKARITPRMPQGVVFAPYHFGANPVNQIWSGAPVTWVTLAK